MNLRPATRNDFERLFDIHRAALQEYIELTWGWDEDWQRAYFHEHFDPSTRHVISYESDVIGFLDLEIRNDCIDLQNIEIDPTYQGRGLGTEIVRRVLVDAKNHSIPVRLQVLKVNPRARALYERLGFVQIGQTGEHTQMALVHRI